MRSNVESGIYMNNGVELVEWTSEKEIEGKFPIPWDWVDCGLGVILMQFNDNCDDGYE